MTRLIIITDKPAWKVEVASLHARILKVYVI